MDDVEDVDDFAGAGVIWADYPSAFESMGRNDPSLLHTMEVVLDNNLNVFQLVAALHQNTTLQHLALLFYERTLELPAERVRALAQTIPQTNIRVLELSTLNDPQGWQHIIVPMMAVAEFVRQSPTIQEVRLCPHREDFPPFNEFGLFMDCLERVQVLNWDFLMSNTNLPWWAVERLLNFPLLNTLVLESTMMDQEHLRCLSRGLTAADNSITKIRLSRCQIDDDGIKAFLEHWQNDSKVKTLELPHNLMKANGVMLLLQAASSHPAMETMDLSCNRDRLDTLSSISVTLPSIVLKELIIRDLRGPTGANHSSVVLRELFVQGMKANTHLVRLDLEHNYLYNSNFLEQLKFYERRNQHFLPYVAPLLSNHDLAPAVWSHVLAKYTDEPSFLFYILNEQPTLLVHRL